MLVVGEKSVDKAVGKIKKNTVKKQKGSDREKR